MLASKRIFIYKNMVNNDPKKFPIYYFQNDKIQRRNIKSKIILTFFTLFFYEYAGMSLCF